MRGVASIICHTQYAAVPNVRRYIVSSPATTSSHFFAHFSPLLALMFVLEEPSSKKRPRSSTRCEDLESHQLTKKKKSASEDCSQPRRRTPSFWNTLSRVWLTRGSLKEFDRRHIQEAGQRCHIPIPYSNSPDGRARQRLKRFARRGGPDLSHLRGVRLHVWPIHGMLTDGHGSLPAYLFGLPAQ